MITERDLKVVRDVCLSQVLSRDQIRQLYFGSLSRTNTRLRLLCSQDLLKVHTTPFHAQHLYVPGRSARDVVGIRIADLMSCRPPSPAFLQHCLAVTNVRLRLLADAATDWRFEQQVKQEFGWRSRRIVVRPDGFVTRNGIPTFLEVDLDHVSLPKFRVKLLGYAAFLESKVFSRTYGADQFELLTVTTTKGRKRRLQELAKTAGVSMNCLTFEELGVKAPGGWS